ncbi:MAG: GNAT family N-acetyltransferase [Alphaproteobacteria bacterium]
MSDKIAIRRAQDQDIKALYQMAEKVGKPTDVDYFEHCLELQGQAKRILFIISYENKDAGYGILNWAPKYALFKKLGIPEIQDLNIVPAMRKRGLATALIQYCEDMARKKNFKEMGIAFGLHANYGPAQRLYVKLGYIPDGQGATYDRKQIAFGEFKPVDDDLCLMLIKTL